MKLKSIISILLVVLLMVSTVTVSMVSAGAEDTTVPETTVAEPVTESSKDEITNPYSAAAMALDDEFAYADRRS